MDPVPPVLTVSLVAEEVEEEPSMSKKKRGRGRRLLGVSRYLIEETEAAWNGSPDEDCSSHKFRTFELDCSAVDNCGPPITISAYLSLHARQPKAQTSRRAAIECSQPEENTFILQCGEKFTLELMNRDECTLSSSGKRNRGGYTTPTADYFGYDPIITVTATDQCGNVDTEIKRVDQLIECVEVDGDERCCQVITEPTASSGGKKRNKGM